MGVCKSNGKHYDIPAAVTEWSVTGRGW